MPRSSYRLRATNRIQQESSSIRGSPKEVTAIRKMAPVNVIVHHPKTEEGHNELARRVADVHASAVTQRLKSLNCPDQKKLELLDAVIETNQGSAD